MEEFKNRYLRPGRKVTDQFLLASVITFAILAIAELFLPIGSLLLGTFERLLGGDHDAAVFLEAYFSFISIWIGMFLVVLIFKINRPMLHAVKYCGSKDRGLNGNPAGNNVWGLLIGLALGFGTNGICILLSALLGDIHLSYSGFKLIPFLVFFISVFIQSAAEELANRWYLYQKLRRRYKSPWFAIIVNSLLFMAMHLANPGITFLSLVQLILVAVFLSLIVYYYNGLWIAMAFHAGWNFTQSIFFGLPNSGIVSAYSVFRLDAASATNGPFYNVNFGVEGEGFYYGDDGQPHLSDNVLHSTETITSFAVKKYTLFSLLPHQDIQTRFMDAYDEKQLSTIELWTNAADSAWTLPSAFTLTEDDSVAAAAIMSDVETSVDENLLGFITGSIPMDTYDAFLQGLHEMGVDDAIAIYQDALDEYLSNE